MSNPRSAMMLLVAPLALAACVASQPTSRTVSYSQQPYSEPPPVVVQSPDQTTTTYVTTTTTPFATAPFAPPAPQNEIIPAAPQPGYAWQAGYWRYTGNAANAWAWQPGRYLQAPAGRAVWQAGHWAQQPSGGWVWLEGRWA